MAIPDTIITRLEELASVEKAEHFQRFFKTGPGQYGSGDLFLGISVPPMRKLAKEFAKELSLPQCNKLLHSKYHEHRMVSLFILVEKFARTDSFGRTEIYQLYLDNIRYINNWDLVDLSSYKIVGEYLADKNRDKLYQLARCGSGESQLVSYQKEDLWANRIAVISTYAFIKDNDFTETLAISEILLDNEHDLIHKAVGWMLREVGKRDQAVEEEFLQKHYKSMPRTMLRYSIEKFAPKRREQYLKGLI